MDFVKFYIKYILMLVKAFIIFGLLVVAALFSISLIIGLAFIILMPLFNLIKDELIECPLIIFGIITAFMVLLLLVIIPIIAYKHKK